MTPWFRWPWPITWSVVFAANLVMPLVFGWDLFRDGDWAGAAWAVLALWAFGMAVSAQSPAMAQSLALGGTVMALMQFGPVLHLPVGALALSLWTGSASGESLIGLTLTPVGGFAVTAMTGGPLMVVAFVGGLVMVWLSGGLRRDVPADGPARYDGPAC